MGMGAKNRNNEHQRIYTFTLDDRDKEQKALMKWLETQSTKAAVLEGLKLVSRGYNTVSGAGENTQQSEQISQLINLLTVTLENRPPQAYFGDIIPHYNERFPAHQAPPQKEKEEPVTELQQENASIAAGNMDFNFSE